MNVSFNRNFKSEGLIFKKKGLKKFARSHIGTAVTD